MSIKGFRCLWIKLQIENKRFLSIPVPVPLYIFQELLDCTLDLLTIAGLFVPKTPNQNSSQITLFTVKELVILVMKMLDSITEGETYDLVDVTTEEVKILIKIR